MYMYLLLFFVRPFGLGRRYVMHYHPNYLQVQKNEEDVGLGMVLKI